MVSQRNVARSESEAAEPTLWGLTPAQLHDLYWAAQGMCVVRRGEAMPPEGRERAYLLIGSRSHVIFKPMMPLPILFWTGPKHVVIRVEHQMQEAARERVIASADGSYVRIARTGDGPRIRRIRVAITTSREVAEYWASVEGRGIAWRKLRRMIPTDRQSMETVRGHVFRARDNRQAEAFVRCLAGYWENPEDTIEGIEQFDEHVWKQADSDVANATRIIGRVWIGGGRRVPADATIAGPAVLWDDLNVEPPAETNGKRKRMLDATKWVERPIHLRRRWLPERILKRGFDIVFSILAMLITLPIYPIVMLAIWLEDGRPFFFFHRREMMRGREFRCWKFRSMRKDAEKFKGQLKKKNLSNGPHFYMEDDPRLTKVGRVIRKLNIDELPQFINVLLGHMSVVGPRPSPHSENQGCSTWREARLSVRPGITGLWQVSRTREVGSDFQEWVRYDVEYVERGGPWMDFKIILQTIMRMVLPR